MFSLYSRFKRVFKDVISALKLSFLRILYNVYLNSLSFGSLKNFINESKYNTLEKLIISSSQMIEKKFKIKNVKIKINKTAVAKRYGSETVSVSN